MKLIINKELDNINDSVNIKIIEITSTDFLNNDLDYFVYKYQIPLIKFTDTEEIFNIKNFKSNLNSSLAETLIIIDENDLELISGGSGGSQDLQSVLASGSTALNIDEGNLSLVVLLGDDPANRYSKLLSSNSEYFSDIVVNPTGIDIDSNAKNSSQDFASITMINGSNLALTQGKLATNDFTRVTLPIETTGIVNIKFPTKPAGTYTIATLDDIASMPNLQTYATNAAAITGGLTVDKVYKTATGELRIVV
jgi:hypothetical protein